MFRPQLADGADSLLDSPDGAASGRGNGNAPQHEEQHETDRFGDRTNWYGQWLLQQHAPAARIWLCPGAGLSGGGPVCPGARVSTGAGLYMYAGGCVSSGDLLPMRP